MESARQSAGKVARLEVELRALVPEDGFERRLLADAVEIERCFATHEPKPDLYGTVIGVKDIISVNGFNTMAGSRLPPKLFESSEASCVTDLKRAGALVLSKTVTTEFAHCDPGPTRNPHNLGNTPGGSSSGSAAGVGAGYFPLALGSQTSGSVIRPAAFCGVFGFKPSFGAIATDGVLLFSPSVDTVGILASDLSWIELASSILIEEMAVVGNKDPICAVPSTTYLEQADRAALDTFKDQVDRLRHAGIVVLQVPLLEDAIEVNVRHRILTAAEVALVHCSWYAEHRQLYGPLIAEIIEVGRRIREPDLEKARQGRGTLREQIQETMRKNGVDLWLSPAATGVAPKGLTNTGDPAMNIPWTHAGLPALTIPLARNRGDLPLGLQCVASFGRDADLIHWAKRLHGVLR